MKPNQITLSWQLFGPVLFVACVMNAFSQSATPPTHGPGGTYHPSTPAPTASGNAGFSQFQSQNTAVQSQLQENARQSAQTIQQNLKAAADAFSDTINRNSGAQAPTYVPQGSYNSSRSSYNTPPTPGGSSTSATSPNANYTSVPNGSSKKEQERLEDMRSAGLLDANGAAWVSDFDMAEGGSPRTPKWINYDPNAVLKDNNASLSQKRRAEDYLAESARQNGVTKTGSSWSDWPDNTPSVASFDPAPPAKLAPLNLDQSAQSKKDVKPLSNSDINALFEKAERAEQAKKEQERTEWIRDLKEINQRLKDSDKSR